MTTGPDTYRDWDAAYVLGSLSPSERHEYEEHLSTCSACSSDVAELAGISGVLRAVPHERAMALLEVDPASEARDGSPAQLPPMPPNLLPDLVRAARRSQSRARARTITWVASGLAAVAAAVLVFILAFGLSGSSGESRHLTMAQPSPSPITAEAILTEQPWGTTIELECSYAAYFDSRPMLETALYGLYVIDREGNATEQATWAAEPGSSVSPTATTALRIEEIDRIEVRWLDSGRVVLEASP